MEKDSSICRLILRGPDLGLDPTSAIAVASPIKGPPHTKMFTGETSLCPGCDEPVYFGE